jgi:maltodextrin utilization protein YvdJ
MKTIPNTKRQWCNCLKWRKKNYSFPWILKDRAECEQHKESVDAIGTATVLIHVALVYINNYNTSFAHYIHILSNVELSFVYALYLQFLIAFACLHASHLNLRAQHERKSSTSLALCTHGLPSLAAYFVRIFCFCPHNKVRHHDVLLSLVTAFLAVRFAVLKL